MLILIIDVDFTELECYYCNIYDKTRVLQEQTKDKAPVMVSDDGYDWRLRNFRDNHAAYLLDKDGNIVTYCHWNYVVPISKFNFEDLHSNILNALQ